MYLNEALDAINVPPAYPAPSRYQRPHASLEERAARQLVVDGLRAYEHSRRALAKAVDAAALVRDRHDSSLAQRAAAERNLLGAFLQASFAHDAAYHTVGEWLINHGTDVRLGRLFDRMGERNDAFAHQSDVMRQSRRQRARTLACAAVTLTRTD